MLISKTVMVIWNGFTRKWYESKGYKWTKQNELFECRIEDLQTASTVKVNVRCDYCGEELPKEYRNYLKEKEIIGKDCCKKCMNIKGKEVMFVKYGVENSMQIETNKQKSREKQQTPFNEVMDYCKNKGLKLLSVKEDYQNDRSRLKIICMNHLEAGIQDTNFANIKKNKGCCGYGREDLIANQIRMNGNVVFDDFVKVGFEPLFKPEDYLKNDQDLPFICPQHRDKGIQYRTYSSLKVSEGCYYCSKERTKEKLKLNQKFVFDKLIAKGLIPIENQVYTTKDNLIYYRCEKHPHQIQYTSYGNFRVSKQCCNFCRAEESLSSLNKKLRSSISKWRKNSEKFCEYKCIFTGSKDYDIHHLYPYNEIIKEAIECLNLSLKNTKDYSGEEIISIRDKVIELHNKYPLGVCLRKDIHILFHVIYGKNPTIKDFEEFKIKYKNKEFKDILKQVV